METEPKPFWQSRKLAYAVGTFLAALVVALLPTLGLSLDPETEEMLGEMLTLVFVLGGLALTGHTATDMVRQWKEGVTIKSVEEAAIEMLEILFDVLGEEEDATPLGEAPPETPDDGGAGFTNEEIDQLRALAADPGLFHERPEVAREVTLGDAVK